MTPVQLLQYEIDATEAVLRKKRKRLAELSKKFTKRSLSQIFPSESASQPFTIDNRQDL